MVKSNRDKDAVLFIAERAILHLTELRKDTEQYWTHRPETMKEMVEIIDEYTNTIKQIHGYAQEIDNSMALNLLNYHKSIKKETFEDSILNIYQKHKELEDLKV